MGFLDGSERVQDVVLTPEGRRLLSLGQLEFAYFSVHDDGLHYRPTNYLSGSLGDEENSDVRPRIEDTPMLEAFPGRPIETAVDVDFVLRPAEFLFDVPAGHRFVPSLQVTPDVTGSLIMVDQGRLDGASAGAQKLVLRQSDNSLTLLLDMRDGAPQEGFLMRLYASGSDGLSEIIPELDAMNRMSYGLDLHATREESVPTAARGEQRVRVSR